MLTIITKMILSMIIIMSIGSNVYGGQQRGRIINISVSVGNTGNCGSAGGSFEARYNGNEIEIWFIYAKTTVYQGTKKIKGPFPDDMFCGKPHPLAGFNIKVEGYWKDSKNFDAMKIFLPTNIKLKK